MPIILQSLYTIVKKYIFIYLLFAGIILAYNQGHMNLRILYSKLKNKSLIFSVYFVIVFAAFQFNFPLLTLFYKNKVRQKKNSSATNTKNSCQFCQSWVSIPEDHLKYSKITVFNAVPHLNSALFDKFKRFCHQRFSVSRQVYFHLKTP